MVSYECNGWLPAFVYPVADLSPICQYGWFTANHDCFNCSVNKKSSVAEAAGSKGVSRWRSDESSEDEGERRTNRESGASLVTRRRRRFSRR
jgi:hypothetical protein